MGGRGYKVLLYLGLTSKLNTWYQRIADFVRTLGLLLSDGIVKPPAVDNIASYFLLYLLAVITLHILFILTQQLVII